MKSVIATVKSSWNRLPDWLHRVLHTAWEAAGGALLTGLTAAHSTADVHATLFASYTAGLSALKAAVLALTARN